jgi:hypothetical protein
MRIRWIQCKSYDEAKNFHDVVYLHEWNSKPFYWGICNNSVFGGNPRTIDGRRRNPRYGPSYRHWIEGCLQHGGKLYIGLPTERENYSLEDIELTLIAQFQAGMNAEVNARIIVQNIEHSGAIPSFMKTNNGQQANEPDRE